MWFRDGRQGALLSTSLNHRVGRPAQPPRGRSGPLEDGLDLYVEVPTDDERRNLHAQAFPVEPAGRLDPDPTGPPRLSESPRGPADNAHLVRTASPSAASRMDRQWWTPPRRPARGARRRRASLASSGRSSRLVMPVAIPGRSSSTLARVTSPSAPRTTVPERTGMVPWTVRTSLSLTVKLAVLASGTIDQVPAEMLAGARSRAAWRVIAHLLPGRPRPPRSAPRGSGREAGPDPRQATAPRS